MDEMYKIKYEPSTFEKNRPGIEAKGSEIEIPKTGRLPNYFGGLEMFSDDEIGKLVPEKHGNLSIEISKNTGVVSYQKDTLQISWMDFRKEWVELYHSEWLESLSYGMDESHSGPYELEERHAKFILKAFNIDEMYLKKRNIQLAEIEGLSPSELEKIALEQKETLKN